MIPKKKTARNAPTSALFSFLLSMLFAMSSTCLFTACSDDEDGDDDDDDSSAVTIGAVLPFTGGASTYGPGAEQNILLAASVIMLVWNWRLALIVFPLLPLILYATRVFQKKMKVAFAEVRAQVANLNSFVQERLTGMKIVQLFTRERAESEAFREIGYRADRPGQ